MCVTVYIALCTTFAHNTAQNKPDKIFSFFPPDNHHCTDDVYLREWGTTTTTTTTYYHYHYFFCLMAIYPGNWVSQLPFGLSPPPVPEENLWGLVEWVFYGPGVLPVTQPSVSKH